MRGRVCISALGTNDVCMCMRRTHPSTCACLHRCGLIGAGAFGNAGSNVCPEGYMRIETESTCKSDALPPRGSATLRMVSNLYPRGCYVSRFTAVVYFNTHARGAGQADSAHGRAGRLPAYLTVPTREVPTNPTPAQALRHTHPSSRGSASVSAQTSPESAPGWRLRGSGRSIVYTH